MGHDNLDLTDPTFKMGHDNLDLTDLTFKMGPHFN